MGADWREREYCRIGMCGVEEEVTRVRRGRMGRGDAVVQEGE